MSRPFHRGREEGGTSASLGWRIAICGRSSGVQRREIGGEVSHLVIVTAEGMKVAMGAAIGQPQRKGRKGMRATAKRWLLRHLPISGSPSRTVCRPSAAGDARTDNGSGGGKSTASSVAAAWQRDEAVMQCQACCPRRREGAR